MTQKENLLVKLYETKNEYNQLTGREDRYDIGKMSEYQIPNMARKMTVAEIENHIRIAESCLENAKKEAIREEYLKTEEGQKALESIREQKRSLYAKYQTRKDEVTAEVNALVEHTEFKVLRLGDTHAELQFGTHQFDTVDVYYDNYNLGEDEPRFEVSVGSTGSFGIDDRRAKYYIAFGKLLASPNLEAVKCLLLGLNKEYEVMSKEAYKLRKEEENLGSNK